MSCSCTSRRRARRPASGSRRAEVTFSIQEGPRVYVRGIEIQGNQAFEDDEVCVGTLLRKVVGAAHAGNARVLAHPEEVGREEALLVGLGVGRFDVPKILFA